MTTIQVQTNESIITKLKNAFTSPACVLSEAMQNARRAEASEVIFKMLADDVLQIIDNGNGFDDLQDFLTLAGSGWDEEVIQKEGAFGMGSFSMLYYCDHIKVESNGKAFESYTSNIIQHGEIELIESTVHTGTVITLTGYVLGKGIYERISSKEITNEELIHDRLLTLAKGFSIPVWFNNEELPQPDRLDNDENQNCYRESEVGMVMLHDSEVNKMKSYSLPFGLTTTQLYYQGLPVGAHSHTLKYNVIHLDEALFEVRMPDRDVLISHNDQLKIINAEVKRLWREVLEEAKLTLPVEQFCEDLYRTLATWDCLDLLNNLEFLPSAVIEQVIDEPFLMRAYFDDRFTTPKSIYKHELDEAGMRLLVLPDSCDEENISVWEYAYHGEFYCYTGGLHKDHWIFSDYLIKIDEENPIKVTLNNVTYEAIYSGIWTRLNTFFGESFDMDGPLGKVENIQSCIYLSEYFHDKEGMFIPTNVMDGSSINKATDFSYNDDWDESAAELEEKLFGAFVLANNDSSENALMSLLNESGIAMLGLSNKSISLTFDDNGLVEAVKAA